MTKSKQSWTPLNTDLKILTGDLNAMLGSDNEGKELILCKHGIGEHNEITEFYTFNDMTLFSL